MVLREIMVRHCANRAQHSLTTAVLVLPLDECASNGLYRHFPSYLKPIVCIDLSCGHYD
jgi:hypothetical protein